MAIALYCAEISAPRQTITRTWGGKCAPVPDVIFDDAPAAVETAAPVDAEAPAEAQEPAVEQQEAEQRTPEPITLKRNTDGSYG